MFCPPGPDYRRLKISSFISPYTLTAMSVPPRPSFLSAELKVICLHLDNLGIIMHFCINDIGL